jgi:pSer/pThr/pTyr-binding forkhead associated (FHA) protein
MPTVDLPEFLQRYCDGSKSGCVVVTSPTQGTGHIFLQDGHVVHADIAAGKGLYAFFTMLLWKDVTAVWNGDMLPPKLAFNESLDILLYHFAQLEDSNQTHDASLRELFLKQNESEEIKLTELSNYEVSFEVLTTEFKGFTFILTKPSTLVGRHDDCDVILPDASVSGHHCTITLEKNFLKVCDLGSTNGTFINDQLTSQGILQLGDTLMLGAVVLQLHLRLVRHLELPSAETPQGVSPAGMPSASHLSLTSRIKPKPSVKREMRVTKAITWENLNADLGKKQSGSIWNRMFKK